MKFLRVEQAARRGGAKSGRKAERRAQQLEHAPAPDAERHAHPKRQCRYHDVQRVRRQGFVGDVQCFADSDDAELQSDDKHGKAAQNRGDHNAQAFECERHRDLHQPGKQRHTEHQWHATDLGGQYRGGEIGRGKDRRGEKSRTDRAAWQRL